MDKETLSSYGWVVIIVIVLALMIGLATPFASELKTNVKDATLKLMGVASDALKDVTKYEGFDEMNGGSGGGGGSGAPTEDPLNPINVIPEGGTYTHYINGYYDFNAYMWHYDDVIVYNAGDPFPDVASGDIYRYGEYEYCYGFAWDTCGTWSHICDRGCGVALDGWTARVVDASKASYGALLESINGEPLSALSHTFYNCSSLESAPAIPSSVTNMDHTFSYSALASAPDMSRATNVVIMSYTFSDCTSLTDLSGLVIPDGVENIERIFQYCSNLTTAPVIPSSVTNMDYAFADCFALAGQVTVNANPTTYEFCFDGVDFDAQGLTLAGSSTKLAELGATGYNYPG